MKRHAVDFHLSLSPNIRVAMSNLKTSANYSLSPRIIFDYELLYLAKGKLRAHIGEHVYEVVEGNAVLIKPGVMHAFQSTSDEPPWMPLIHFDLLYRDDFRELYTSFKPFIQLTAADKRLIREDLLSGPPFDLPALIRLNNHEFLFKRIMELIKVHSTKRVHFQLEEKYIFLQLFYELLSALRIESDPAVQKHAHRLTAVRDYIIQHAERRLTLDELAQISCLSPYYLERLFRKCYGVALIQYQQQYRMEQALEMMGFTVMSLSAIAEKIGYCSVHAFSKAFKKRFGISPEHYRATKYVQ
jgi:AraC-like DNA-binding protein